MNMNTNASSKLDILNTALCLINGKVDRVLYRLQKDDGRRDRWLSMLTESLRLKKVLSHAVMIVELDQKSVHVRVYNETLREAVDHVERYLASTGDFYHLISCASESIEPGLIKDESLRGWLDLALEEL